MSIRIFVMYTLCIAHVMGGCCLMTPGLRKDIRCHCMTILFFLNLEITRSDIRPHIKWAVSLVITYGHFNLPQGFVWALLMIILTNTNTLTKSLIINKLPNTNKIL